MWRELWGDTSNSVWFGPAVNKWVNRLQHCGFQSWLNLIIQPHSRNNINNQSRVSWKVTWMFLSSATPSGNIPYPVLEYIGSKSSGLVELKQKTYSITYYEVSCYISNSSPGQKLSASWAILPKYPNSWVAYPKYKTKLLPWLSCSYLKNSCSPYYMYAFALLSKLMFLLKL